MAPDSHSLSLLPEGALRGSSSQPLPWSASGSVPALQSDCWDRCLRLSETPQSPPLSAVLAATRGPVPYGTSTPGSAHDAHVVGTQHLRGLTARPFRNSQAPCPNPSCTPL